MRLNASRRRVTIDEEQFGFDIIAKALIFFVFARLAILLLMGVSSIATALYAGAHGFTALLILGYMTQLLKKRISFRQFAISFVCITLVTWTIIATWQNAGDGELIKTFTFATFAGFAYSMEYVNLSRDTCKRYYKWVTIVSVLLVLSIIVPGNYSAGKLVLYAVNSNESGTIYMSLFINLFAGVIMYKRKPSNNFLMILLLIGVFYGCWCTGSRSAIIACLVCLVLTLVFRAKPKYLPWILTAAFILAIAFPIISSSFADLLGQDFEILGETVFTGRDIIWGNVLEELRETPLKMHFGEKVPTKGFAYYGKGLNSHNSILEIMWRYSVPIGIVFLIMFYMLIRRLIAVVDAKKYAPIMAGFCAAIVHMSLEASLFVSALDYTLYFILPLFIAVSLSKKDIKESLNAE